ncbi:NOP protein chaperone 1 [Narcine bancroftii]|uniref:NOP protein chaperone 1 n=1 Tax=Narcine bancroftii TaxID=1343680 RepID=UPI00383146DA
MLDNGRVPPGEAREQGAEVSSGQLCDRVGVINPLRCPPFLETLSPFYFIWMLRDLLSFSSTLERGKCFGFVESGFTARAGGSAFRVFHTPVAVGCFSSRQVSLWTRATSDMAAGDVVGKRCSAALLRAGSEAGIEQKLLIGSACSQETAPPKIVKVPRSEVLDRLQDFLPRMAKANTELRKQMEMAEGRRFDIENVEDCPGRIIEMDLSFFEMGSESGAEEWTSDDSQSDEESFGEVTAANLKLPTAHPQRSGHIEVVSVDQTQ